MKLKTYLLIVMILFSSRLAIGIEGLRFPQEPVKNSLIWRLESSPDYEWLFSSDEGRTLLLNSVRQGLRDYLNILLRKGECFESDSDLVAMEKDAYWHYENSVRTLALKYRDLGLPFPYTENNYDFLLKLESREETFENGLKSKFPWESIVEKPLMEHQTSMAGLDEEGLLRECFDVPARAAEEEEEVTSLLKACFNQPQLKGDGGQETPLKRTHRGTRAGWAKKRRIAALKARKKE